MRLAQLLIFMLKANLLFKLSKKACLAPTFRLINSATLNSTSSLSTKSTKQMEASDQAVTIEIDPRSYPIAERADIVDELHGNRIPDPYRALEDPDAEKTQNFVNQLNALSQPFLQACPVRERIRERLTELWDYEKYSCTSIRGEFFYYYYNSGLQNHSVLYQQKSLDEKGRVFLDPNKLSEDGTTAVSQTAWTEDGTVFAYGVCEKGSDWTTVKFKTCTGDDIEDQIPGVKFSGLSWLHDNSGLFYSKYPNHKSATEGSSTEKHEFHSLYFHKMGTSATEDVLVAGKLDDPNWMTSAHVSEDGRNLFVDYGKGCDPTNQVYFFNLSAMQNEGAKIDGKLELNPLFDRSDAKYDVVDSDEKHALVLTNHKAPMFKLVRVKIGEGAKPNQNDEWEEVIGEDEKRKLEWAMPVHGDKLLVCYNEDVKNTLYVHSLESGALLYQLPLEIGSIGGVYGRKKDSRIFFSFESFLTPTIVYQGDFAKGSPIKITELRRVNVKGMDTAGMHVEQVFFESKDGTKVPMYILRKRGTLMDGRNGAFLTGYGGFNIADLPSFSVSRLLFVHHFGAIAAIANLRGGSEYGERWHEAGMRENKQNVFDDFISAAEYLIGSGYTNPQKLAIHGASNGGLLTAVCSQQRPDLFGGVLTRVGVLDMLRFHKFTIGAAWVPEFGNPDDPEDFKFLYKYSPLHNISLKPGQQWPSTLLMSADHDDRVVPLHTLKYMAQLYHVLRTEAAEWQRKPVLARIEVKAGHGAGKPTSKIIGELVDMYSFLQRVLDLKWID